MRRLGRIWYSYEGGGKRKGGEGLEVRKGKPTRKGVSGWGVVEGGRKKVCGGGIGLRGKGGQSQAVSLGMSIPNVREPVRE